MDPTESQSGSASQTQQSNHFENEPIEDLEWEEWDGKSPFLHHCIAGSIAGVAEHTLLYPVDTVKTHMQAYCSTCPNNPINMSRVDHATKPVCIGPPSKSKGATVSQVPQQQGMWTTMRNLVKHGNAHGYGHHTATARQTATLSLPKGSNGLSNTTITSVKTLDTTAFARGYARLWRGVQTMTAGCIPAHALYFSSYEFTKDAFTVPTVDAATGRTVPQLHPLGAGAAGAVSTMCHDIVMTPLDTIKQRMQLGHYRGMGHAISYILHHEGWAGLYRSFGVTVLTNVPYGMIMVTTNEFLRDSIMNLKAARSHGGSVHHQVLDIQTTMMAGCGAGAVAAGLTTPLDRVKTRLQTQEFANAKPMHQDAVKACPKAGKRIQERLKYNGLIDAFGSIVKEEGYAGLWRGMAPRLMTHTPAVAISWTTYETAKRWLS